MPGASTRVAREEFRKLQVYGQAELMSAIKARERGEPVDIKPVMRVDGEMLWELRVRVGNDQFRALFFEDSPVHDVCVLAVYKNQKKIPQTVKDRAVERMRRWRAVGGLE